MKKIPNFEARVKGQELKNHVYDVVINAIDRRAEDSGLMRKDIAEKLGFSKAHVSRLLSGPGNWTLDTVAGLLYAVDADMNCKAVFSEDVVRVNYQHPFYSTLDAQKNNFVNRKLGFPSRSGAGGMTTQFKHHVPIQSERDSGQKIERSFSISAAS